MSGERKNTPRKLLLSNSRKTSHSEQGELYAHHIDIIIVLLLIVSFIIGVWYAHSG